MKRIILAALLAFAAWPAIAQTNPPTPPPTAFQPPAATAPVPLAISGTTARVALTALPALYPSVMVINDTTSAAYCRLGDVTVVATTAAYQIYVPAGGKWSTWDASSTYVACITAGGTGTLHIAQSNGAAQLSAITGTAAGGGGAPTGPAGGDLSGTYPNPQVATIGGVAPGTAAFLNSGTTNGTVPLIGAGNVLAPGVLPLATTGAFGAVKPDGTSITISAGVISSVGGVTFANPTATAATAAVNGVSTSAMRADAAPALGTTVGTGSLVRATNTALVAPALGTIASGNLAAGTGYTLANLAGLGTGTGTLLGGPSSGTGGPAGTISPTFTGTMLGAAETLSGTFTLSGLSGTNCLQEVSGVVGSFGSPCTPNGTGAVVTSSQTPSAADWAAFKFIVLNGNSLDIKPVASAGLQPNGGGLLVLAEGTSDTFTVTSPDTIKYGSTTSGAGGVQPLTQGGLYSYSTDGAGHVFSNVVGGGSSGITNGTTTYTSPAAATSVPFVAAGVMTTSTAFTSDTSGNVNVASLASAGQFSTAQDVTFGSGFSHIYSGPAGSGFGCIQTPAAGDWKFSDTNCNPTFEFSPTGLKVTGTIPTVTGTGTPTIAAGSTDFAGRVVGGASAVSIVIHSFDAAVTAIPFCSITPEVTGLTSWWAIPTVVSLHWLLTITLAPATSAAQFSYQCTKNGP